MAAGYRPAFNHAEGVVFIGVAQGKAQAFKGHRKQKSGYAGFDYSRQSVRANHYYSYLQDQEFGAAFIKACSYALYPVKVCLNGHE